MNWMQEAVEAFHEATDSTVGMSPELRDAELRAKLILEEACETAAAMGFNAQAILRTNDGTTEIANFSRGYPEADFVDAIDGIADLLYVTFGTAVAWGIDAEPFFEEVHRANMTKLDGPKRADGKQLKPDNWQPPRIAQMLDEERALARLWTDISDGTFVVEPQKTNDNANE